MKVPFYNARAVTLRKFIDQGQRSMQESFLAQREDAVVHRIEDAMLKKFSVFAGKMKLDKLQESGDLEENDLSWS